MTQEQSKHPMAWVWSSLGAVGMMAAWMAAWIGLRPMTELEYEKACRGPREPVAREFAWGTPGIATEEYAVANIGLSDERITNNAGVAVGNDNYELTMPECLSVASRGRRTIRCRRLARRPNGAIGRRSARGALADSNDQTDGQT